MLSLLFSYRHILHSAHAFRVLKTFKSLRYKNKIDIVLDLGDLSLMGMLKLSLKKNIYIYTYIYIVDKCVSII